MLLKVIAFVFSAFAVMFVVGVGVGLWYVITGDFGSTPAVIALSAMALGFHWIGRGLRRYANK